MVTRKGKGNLYHQIFEMEKREWNKKKKKKKSSHLKKRDILLENNKSKLRETWRAALRSDFQAKQFLITFFFLFFWQFFFLWIQIFLPSSKYLPSGWGLVWPWWKRKALYSSRYWRRWWWLPDFNYWRWLFSCEESLHFWLWQTQEFFHLFEGKGFVFFLCMGNVHFLF